MCDTIFRDLERSALNVLSLRFGRYRGRVKKADDWPYS